MSTWISPVGMPTETHLYEFEKRFSATDQETLSLRVSADTRYALYLNGNLISEGPCQSQEGVTYYETVDAPLQNGENILVSKVLHIVGDAFISCYRSEAPALWLDGRVTGNGEERLLGTDASWSCRRDDSIRFDWMLGYLHISMPPQEEHFAKIEKTPLVLRELYVPSSRFNAYGLREHYGLLPRPIPQMKAYDKKQLKIVRRGAGFVDLDAGIYTTAKVFLTLRATNGKLIKLNFAECCGIPEEPFRNEFQKDLRDRLDDTHRPLGASVDLLHANGEAQSFSPFWYRAFRFLRLEFDADTEIEILNASYAPYFYPFSEEGRFHSDNERYNQMWEVSRNTLLCCSHEMFVDCPYYEQQQYQMDSALESLFAYRLSTDTALCKKALCELAASQMPDGLLQANYPSTHVQIIPNFTLFWILNLRDYLRYTDDIQTVRTLAGTMDKALAAFEALKNADGLLDPTPYWNYTDWVDGWERGILPGADEEPSAVTCLLYAAALRAAAEIMEALENALRAEEYRTRAERMSDAVNAHFFDAEAGLYRNVPTRREFSGHAVLWAVLSKTVTGENAGRLIDRAFSETCPIPLPSHSMNHYFFRALEMANRYCYAPRLFAGWESMLDDHCTTWCEGPRNPRSECHAWSAAPMYEFSAMLLGVYPTTNGYRRVRIRPETHSLQVNAVKGSVPTPHGVIGVEWIKQNGSFTMTVTLPHSEMVAEVILPDGECLIQTEPCKTYCCKE